MVKWEQKGNGPLFKLIGSFGQLRERFHPVLKEKRSNIAISVLGNPSLLPQKQ